MIQTTEILVADECWVALALLHREHPEQVSFSAREIADRLKKERAHPEFRAGVTAHLYQHNVANVAPSSARYRLFYKLTDGSLRLFRPGDDAHGSRRGKTSPERSDLPDVYHPLVEWYEKEYCQLARPASPPSDLLLQMRGVGKKLWASLGGGDAFVARERTGWERAAPTASEAPPDKRFEQVWLRITQHQGAEFQTKTGLPFTYCLDGHSGIWFERDGRRINQRLGRGEVEKAVQRCPLGMTTEISDLRDYAYLYGLLMDRRIRQSDW
jgi:hypothetical protein